MSDTKPTEACLRTRPTRKALYLERRVARLEWQRGSVRWRHAWRRLQREHDRELREVLFTRSWFDSLMLTYLVPQIVEGRDFFAMFARTAPTKIPAKSPLVGARPS